MESESLWSNSEEGGGGDKSCVLEFLLESFLDLLVLGLSLEGLLLSSSGAMDRA